MYEKKMKNIAPYTAVYCNDKVFWFREAAKKVLFLMDRPLRPYPPPLVASLKKNEKLHTHFLLFK